jgi:hypothetical protein
MQVKLLRAIQERRCARWAPQEDTVDVRIINDAQEARGLVDAGSPPDLYRLRDRACVRFAKCARTLRRSRRRFSSACHAATRRGSIRASQR